MGILTDNYNSHTKYVKAYKKAMDIAIGKICDLATEFERLGAAYKTAGATLRLDVEKKMSADRENPGLRVKASGFAPPKREWWKRNDEVVLSIVAKPENIGSDRKPNFVTWYICEQKGQRKSEVGDSGLRLFLGDFTEMLESAAGGLSRDKIYTIDAEMRQSKPMATRPAR